MSDRPYIVSLTVPLHTFVLNELITGSLRYIIFPIDFNTLLTINDLTCMSN